MNWPRKYKGLHLGLMDLLVVGAFIRFEVLVVETSIWRESVSTCAGLLSRDNFDVAKQHKQVKVNDKDDPTQLAPATDGRQETDCSS